MPVSSSTHDVSRVTCDARLPSSPFTAPTPPLLSISGCPCHPYEFQTLLYDGDFLFLSTSFRPRTVATRLFVYSEIQKPMCRLTNGGLGNGLGRSHWRPLTRS